MIDKPGKNKHRAFTAITLILCSLLAFIGGTDSLLPQAVSVFEGEDVSVPTYATAEYTYGQIKGFCSHTTANVNVFGIDFKSVPVSVYKNIRLCPGGNTFGVKLKTKGVVVIGMNDIRGHSSNPAYDAGIRIGDIITSVNGIQVLSAEDITKLVNESGGNAMKFTYSREGTESTANVTPLLDSNDSKYKTGIWVRDSTAGIGTVTYTDPKTGYFGGLGHGICDIDTGVLLPLEKGELYDVVISGVTKGTAGTPGELKGFFIDNKKGVVYSNTECGVFGKADTVSNDLSDAIPIALRDEIKVGSAEIICTTEENTKVHYSIEIQKIFEQSTNTKNFIVRIADERLLEKTGGIVQGMSGSPIIQNGKLVGAVTHVLVNDPKRGYGIFIENMLAASTPQN